MKVVIHIPNDEYRMLKHYCHPNDAKEFTNAMIERIAKGTPLSEVDDMVVNKIRTEVQSMDFDFGDYYDNTNEIIEMVLDVIGKCEAEIGLQDKGEKESEGTDYDLG